MLAEKNKLPEHADVLRILHLVSSARWSGAADPAVSVACGLKQRGHKVSFACISGRTLIKKAVEYNLEPLDDFSLNRNNPLYIIKDIIRLKRFILDKKPDIIHLHLSHDHWLGVIAAKMAQRAGSKVKVIRTMHRLNRLRTDTLHKYLFRELTDFTIVLSDKARGELISLFGLPEHKIATIYGGVDEERYHPNIDGAGMRAKLGIACDTALIGLVSHLHSDRGHKEAAAAFMQIRRQFPQAKLIFLGETDEEHYQYLKREVENKGLAEDIIFVVDTPFEQWPKQLAMLDIVMYLAAGSEDSARAVLEAMSLAKPVIAADVGAVSEIVKHKQTGLIIADTKPDNIAQALSYMLKDMNCAKRWGLEGRKLVETKFNNRMRTEATEAAYRVCHPELSEGSN